MVYLPLFNIIYLHEWLICMVNVSKCTIHESSGIPQSFLLGKILQGAHLGATLGGKVAIRVDVLHNNRFIELIYLKFCSRVSVVVEPKSMGKPPKSSILIGFYIINPFWGTPILGNIHMVCKKDF